MMTAPESPGHPVTVSLSHNLARISLNRPHALNSLTGEMIGLLRRGVDDAESREEVRLLLFTGSGERGFCAGGDIKEIARAVREKRMDDAGRFFQEEFALDLAIHRSKKPVVVIADGITMGGGLGIAAGAAVVIATERTRMAMPEARIGFFSDVGATGWLFAKCPAGYPEYLALTGYEMRGKECLRLGLASHFLSSRDIPRVMAVLEAAAHRFSPHRETAVQEIGALLDPFTDGDIPEKPEMDAWVARYFAGRTSVPAILDDLAACSVHEDLCGGVFAGISERSPTALVVTLALMRRNEGRPLEEVFAAEAKAARFMIARHDYLEGIRARVLDRDNRPRWIPDRIDAVNPADFSFL